MSANRESKRMLDDSRRGQTTIDFLIGAGIFLITVSLVFGLVPGMIDPFGDAQEDSIVADRVVSLLVDGMLSDPASPNILDETCTYVFFDETYSGDGDDCPVAFDETESDLAERVGISSSHSVNVTLQRNVTGGPAPDVLCRNGDSVEDCSLGGSELAIGPSTPSRQSAISARRTAYIDGKDVILKVIIW